MPSTCGKRSLTDARLGLYIGKRGIDLVGDASHHLAQRGHLLGLDQHQFRFLQMLERLRQLLGAVLHLLLETLIRRLQRVVGLVDLHIALAQLPGDIARNTSSAAE